MPGDFGVPVCSCAFSLVGLAHETAGAPCTRHSRAPFVWRDAKLTANLEQSMLRECGAMSQCHSHASTSLRGALATKQSILAFPVCCAMDCFAALAMRVGACEHALLPSRPRGPCRVVGRGRGWG